MKNIKYIALALCALLVMALAGCTSEPADQDTSLQDVLDAGKIVWGTNAEFTPFEYVDGAGNVVGVDAEIAQAIADELGVELVVENILFDSLPAALEGGSIDFIGAGFTVNEERLQKMDFTDTYFIAKQVVVV